jgi:hypothetical protein
MKVHVIRFDVVEAIVGKNKVSYLKTHGMNVQTIIKPKPKENYKLSYNFKINGFV